MDEAEYDLNAGRVYFSATTSKRTKYETYNYIPLFNLGGSAEALHMCDYFWSFSIKKLGYEPDF